MAYLSTPSVTDNERRNNGSLDLDITNFMPHCKNLVSKEKSQLKLVFLFNSSAMKRRSPTNKSINYGQK